MTNHKWVLSAAAISILSACVVAPPPPPRVVYVQTQAPVVYQAPAPQSVVSVYIDPPIYQPPPVRVAWAPPAMLVELPPPQPFDGAVWTGGYWVWDGNWIWAHGRWAPPPQIGYAWVHPYYENRGGSVIFVNGFWAAPGVRFIAPSVSLNIAFAAVNVGVIAGPRPIGPDGCFVPPPPGSRFGLIVPAPIGTPPAVVTGAPPVIREGMRINSNNNNVNNSNNTYVNNNVTNNVNNIKNVTNVTNVTNLTIVAPPGVTANGQAVNTSVPAQAHLAAMMPPVVKAMAPEPASAKPIPAFVPGRGPVTMPAPQMVRSEVQPHMMQATQNHPNDQAKSTATATPQAAPMHASVPQSPSTSPTNLGPNLSPNLSPNTAVNNTPQPMQQNQPPAQPKVQPTAQQPNPQRDKNAMEQAKSKDANLYPAPGKQDQKYKDDAQKRERMRQEQDSHQHAGKEKSKEQIKEERERAEKEKHER